MTDQERCDDLEWAYGIIRRNACLAQLQLLGGHAPLVRDECHDHGKPNANPWYAHDPGGEAGYPGWGKPQEIFRVTPDGVGSSVQIHQPKRGTDNRGKGASKGGEG